MTAPHSGELTRCGRVSVMLCGATWAGALFVLFVWSPQGSPVSSDPGAPSIPYWVTLLPVTIAVTLTLLIPFRAPARPVTVRRRDQLIITTVGLSVLAVGFPLSVVLVPLTGEFYTLGKLVLVMIVPAVLLTCFPGAVQIDWSKDRSRWWGPAVVITVWTLLSQVAPWNPRFELGDLDPGLVVVGALVTAFTAGSVRSCSIDAGCRAGSRRFSVPGLESP